MARAFVGTVRLAACLVAMATTCAAVADDSAGAVPSSGAAIERIVTAHHAEVASAGRRSNDLRLRILFAREFVVDARGTRLVDRIPLAELVESARGSSDPLVLQLLLERCREKAGDCDVVDLARRWSDADAQNQIAWVERAAVLEAAGDAKGAAEAWARAGRASTFRDPWFAIVRALRAAWPVDPDPRVRDGDLQAIIGVTAAVPSLWPSDLVKGCRVATRRAACAAIADTAWRDADTIVALETARSLTAEAREPEWMIAARRQASEALQWVKLAGDEEAPTPDPSDLAGWRAANARLEDRIVRGEIAPARDALRARKLSDAEGARRYAAYMADLMKRLRND